MSVPQYSARFKDQGTKENYLPPFFGQVIDNIYYNNATDDNEVYQQPTRLTQVQSKEKNLKVKIKRTASETEPSAHQVVGYKQTVRKSTDYPTRPTEINWIIIQNIVASEYLKVKYFFISIGTLESIHEYDSYTLLLLYRSVNDMLEALKYDTRPIYWGSEAIYVSCQTLNKELFDTIRESRKSTKWREKFKIPDDNYMPTYHNADVRENDEFSKWIQRNYNTLLVVQKFHNKAWTLAVAIMKTLKKFANFVFIMRQQRNIN